MKKVSNTIFHFINNQTLYTQQKELPSYKKNLFLRLLILPALIFILVFGSSCKTCKCPAYSDIGKNTSNTGIHG